MNLITSTQAIQRIRTCAREVEPEVVPLRDASGRRLAQDVRVAIDVPSFEQSAMDGYAVVARDTQTAREGEPVRLSLIDAEARAGAGISGGIMSGQAARIFTGAVIPDGATAVVRQEHVSRDGASVLLSNCVAEGADVRRAGELLAAGDLLARAGEPLTPELAGLMASQGMSTARVSSAPAVVLLTGGDEIVPVGEPLGPGQLYDSNALVLESMCRGWGLGDIQHVRMRDNITSIIEDLSAVARGPVVVVSAGGVSVGDHDHVRAAATHMGFETVLWGVAQRPGKPMFFGASSDSYWLGLPGNPHASVVCARLYLRELFVALGVLAPTRWFDAPSVAPHRRGFTMLEPMRWGANDAGEVSLDLLDGRSPHMKLARANALCVTAPDGTRRWTMC